MAMDSGGPAPVNPISADQAKAILEAAKERVGRDVRVYFREAAIASSSDPSSPKKKEESEDFYEFTADDYARLMSSKREEVFLKTKKIREAEVAARRARTTKAIVRVQFPDNVILEAVFCSMDPVSLIIDLLRRALRHADRPFYIYTTPPKQRVKLMEQTMYEAGLAPGGLVYFSFEEAEIGEEPYLRDEIMALRDLHLLLSPVSDSSLPEKEVTDSMQQGAIESSAPVPKDSSAKRPKWFKPRK